MIEAARDSYEDKGLIEINDNARVSRDNGENPENGAYVAAWVWVDYDDVEN